MSGEPAVFHNNLKIRGRDPIRRPLTVRADADIMVFARERGVDVTLEITDSSGHELGRADSPVRRTGMQRLELEARANQTYYLVLAGKDEGDTSATVQLRAIDTQRIVNLSCLNAQRILAKADQAYAAGQAVTRSVAGAAGVSSGKAYSEAADGYREAIATLSVFGASPLLAEAQHAEAAVLYQDVQSWTEAKSWATEAERTYDSLNDDYGAARARGLEGVALIEIGASTRSSPAPSATSQPLDTARTLLKTVAEFHGPRHELYDEAWALNNLGIAYYVEDRYDEAISSYKESLRLFVAVGARSRQALVLQNIALVEYELGRFSEAVPHYQRVLDVLARRENPKLSAIVLNNLALANWASGNEDAALREYSQSLELARNIQDTYEQAVALHGLASVYNTLGDQTRALAFYNEALALRSSDMDPRGRTASLRAIANLLRQQGRAQEALAMHREALSLASAPSMKARIVLQLVKDLDDLGKSAEAARELAPILSRRTPGDDVEFARALQERAIHRIAARDPAGAETDLRAAVNTFRTFELPTDEFGAWVALAGVMRQRGDSTQALAAVDHALALAEEVRHQSANPELRSTLLQPLRPAFDLKISMLADQYFAAPQDPKSQEFAAEALQTAEHARARALSDFQNIDVMAPGLDARLLDRRRAIYRELATRRFRLETSLDHAGTTDSQSQAIRSEIATLRRNIDEIDAQIGAASETAHAPRRLEQQAALRLDRIPPKVAVVEYWLGDKQAFAWAVTRDGIKMVRLGSSSVINSKAMALHETLRNFGVTSKTERFDAAERLYATILGPLAAQVAPNRTLIFAPDGALHYVPFATLRAAENGRTSFLVESHDIAVTPSIEMLLRPEEPHAAPPNGGRMLLVADPVYGSNDSRIARSSANADSQSASPTVALLRGAADGMPLPRLPGATREASAIAALLPSASIDRLDGFTATRDRFLGADLNKYRFIHVASHATTDPEIPQASALILSTVDNQGKQIDGRVLAADFMSMRLRADAVVLSACDTALGKSVAGEGLVGLRYVVLARGARSVVSSLWPAADQVAADLMVRFYSDLLQHHASVISAWSAASREMLPGRYADPGTWGAFMLTLSHIGDVSSM